MYTGRAHTHAQALKVCAYWFEHLATYMYEHLGTSEENSLICKNPIFDMKYKYFAENQKEILMKSFQASVRGYPEMKEIDQLAEFFNVGKRKVKDWFRYQRRLLAAAGMLPQSE